MMYVFIHRVGKQEAIRIIQVKETGEAWTKAARE